MLYEFLEKAPPAELESRSLYMKERDNDFFRVAQCELQKINLFFAKKLAEANQRFTELQNRYLMKIKTKMMNLTLYIDTEI